MNLMKIPYRLSHVAMRNTLKLLKFPIPPVLEGPGMVSRFPEIIEVCGVRKALVVTDKNLMTMGLLDPFLKALKAHDIETAIFDGVQENPTIDNIHEGLTMYMHEHCDSVIAFGGGSPIDCAKIIAARVTNNIPVLKMRGLFKLTRKLPPLFAVPTTAGTGSETTIVAVITDREKREKFLISDPKLVPLATVLDPELTVSLPKTLTASTGMDALTHAIEAFIGWYDLPFVQKKAIEAVKTIMSDLEKGYMDGSNLSLRFNMLKASFNAGLAFTRAYVGYVHAVAHSLGGYYGVPHGFANAVILPIILDFSLEEAAPKLAELARCAGIGDPSDSDVVLAAAFVAKIREMNRHMGIPENIDALQVEDIPELAQRILREANPAYPVPKIMNEDQCIEILEKLRRKDH